MPHTSSTDLTQIELGSIHDALLSPHWTITVNEELLALSANQTWYVVPLQPVRIPNV